MIQEHIVNGQTIIPGRMGSAIVADASRPGIWLFVTVNGCQCETWHRIGQCLHHRAVRSFYGADCVDRSNGVDDHNGNRSFIASTARTGVWRDRATEDGEYVSYYEWRDRVGRGLEG